jgi:tol-pal system protein YbgF
MTHLPLRATSIALFSILVWASAAGAQGSGFLDGIFGGGRDRPAEDAGSAQMAQMSGAELVVRLERLENHIRQLTGAVEQLQHRNQQLEQQLRRSQEDNEFRFQELSAGRGGQRAPTATRQPSSPPPAQAQPNPPAAAPAPQPGRRSDVFDPSENPGAPGAPRVLGGGGTVVAAAPPRSDQPEIAAPEIGAPGGREPGEPLDLSTLANNAASDPALAAPPASPPVAAPPAVSGPLPAPPPRNPSATGATAAVLPPSASPQDEFDLGLGYVKRKDYALAEQTLRGFLTKYPSDRLAPDAHYWLGESLFQRQRYRDAAEAFLTVSTNYETAGKAPDSLLRLGQSLAALGEKETACAALGEVTRKYPRAAVGVKQGVEREQKRVRC